MKLKWASLAIATFAGAAIWNFVGTPHRGANALGAESEKGQSPAPAKPPYVHSVVFYLKSDAPKNQVDVLIADAHRLLERVPSVKSLWIGRPAEKSTPKLAVDFDVSMLLLFDDFSGLEQYLEHKLHLEFREKHAKYAEKVLVYDFINQQR